MFRSAVVAFVGLLLGVSVAVGAFADVNETAAGSPNALAQGSISLGEEHSCVVLSGGTVECWGRNSRGQLGDGTTTDRLTPVSVLSSLGVSLSGVTAISSGGYHTCALLSGGTVECWGRNLEGQLGDGTTTDRSTPVSVSSLSGVMAISSGDFHSCALLSGGTVKCWGLNNAGQLGDGTTTNRSTAVSVSSLSGVVAISPGGYHTCALLSGGTVKCWGLNISGQLGDGTTTNSSTPVSVSALLGVAAISSGDYHTCALLTGGTVECWGRNTDGQLGDGTTTDSSTPVSVLSSPGVSLSGVAAISSGGFHTCALLSGGTVECWGDNVAGQLGDGTTTDRSTPVSVSSLSGVAAISSGGYHTCALLSGGTVECSGYNADGQLGDGTTTNRSTPVSVLSLTGVGVTTTTAPAAPRVPGQVPPWPEAVVSADGSVVVSWDVPFQDGAGPITGYRVVSSPSGGSCVTSPFDAELLSCVVAGLEPEVDYLFEVFASNGVGEGAGRMTQQSVRLLPEVPATTVPVTTVPATTVESAPESVPAVVGQQPLPVTGSDEDLAMWSLLFLAFGAFMVLRVRVSR